MINNDRFEIHATAIENYTPNILLTKTKHPQKNYYTRCIVVAALCAAGKIVMSHICT